MPIDHRPRGAPLRRTTKRGTRRPRHGAALLLVLMAISVMAIMASNSILTSLQAVRAGRRQAVQARAQAVAEYGANSQLASWPSSRAGLAVGATETQEVTAATGDVASVTVIKLNSANFLVTSIGRVSIGNGRLEAARTVSQVVRAASVTITPTSAMATGHIINLNSASGGSTSLSGTNTAPPGWGSCAAGPNVPAVTHATGSTPTRHRNFTVSGSITPVSPTDVTTAYDALRSTLVPLASITLPSSPVSPSPAESGSPATCTASSTNWGEPYRGTRWGGGGANQVRTSCQSRFPVVYRNGDLSISGGARGQGILVVDGSLNISGNFDWSGVILVRDRVNITGSAVLYGAVYVRGDVGNGSPSQSQMTGAASLTYSSCAVTEAGNSIGGIRRVSQRPWAGLY